MSDISEKRSVIEKFHRGVDQSAFILKENPELVFPQVYNRLQWQAEKEEILKEKLEFERSRYKKPWFRLLSKPALQTSALIRTFTGHTGYVGTYAFSPDGKRIVLGDSSGQVLLLSLENFKIYPPIVTPYQESGELFFHCQYCLKTNKIEESSLGHEVNCSSCGNKHKLNPFLLNLD